MLDVVAAMDDIFEPWFRGSTWNGWKAVLRGAYALPMTDDDREFFRTVAAREPPNKRVREFWAVAGRRAGKDSIASYIVASSAALFDQADRLRPGERAVCMCIAADRTQAGIILNYIRAYFTEIEPLRAMVERETATGLELTNNVDIVVVSNSFRAVRGRAILCAVLDECAFYRDETSALPDKELYRAITPGMATLPGAMLIGISSPYKKSGLLYEKFKASYGVDDDKCLVIKAPSRVLNPSLDQAEIDRALEEDPASASAEWLGEFRDDVAGFLTLEMVEAAVETGVMVRPPVQRLQYFAFVDAASGTGQDSFTLCIAHRERETVVIDVAHEIRPRFNPQDAIAELSALLRSYGVYTVRGDKYAPGFVHDAFQRHSIAYKYSEKDRSQLYIESLPLFTSGRVRLVDNRRLVTQLATLERRTSSTGRDRVDHPRGGHDDIANAVAGAIVVGASERRAAHYIRSSHMAR